MRLATKCRGLAEGRNGPLTPALSPSEGEREKPLQSVLQVEFMVPMRNFEIVEAPHRKHCRTSKRRGSILNSRRFKMFEIQKSIGNHAA
jgi:hypothetical protein